MTSLARRVVCAALRNSKGAIVLGVRHFDAIMRAQMRRGEWRRAEEGFVDQFGAFMNRFEALLVARAAGQIIRRCGGDERELFSENLY